MRGLKKSGAPGSTERLRKSGAPGRIGKSHGLRMLGKGIGMAFLLTALLPGRTMAAQTGHEEPAKEVEIDESLLDEMEFQDVDKILEEAGAWQQDIIGLFGGEKESFRDMVTRAIHGEKTVDFNEILKTIGNSMLWEVDRTKNNLIMIILIIVITGVFSNVAKAFQNHQIADMSFMIMYLLLFVSILVSFSAALSLAHDTIRTLSGFITALAPAYFLSVAMAGGVTSATVYYSFTLTVISIVEWLLLSLVLPCVQVYLVLSLVNHLSREELLTYFLDLIRTAVEYLLKTLIGIAVGIGVIQSMIGPVLDSFRNTMFSKAVSSIPGVGNAAGGLTELFLGSAVVIKNGIGATGLLVMLYITLAPVAKLFIMILMYKLATAVAGLVSDKEIAKSLMNVGESGKMLLHTLVGAMVLFMATIAIVAASTNGGY